MKELDEIEDVIYIKNYKIYKKSKPFELLYKITPNIGKPYVLCLDFYAGIFHRLDLRETSREKQALSKAETELMLLKQQRTDIEEDIIKKKQEIQRLKLESKL